MRDDHGCVTNACLSPAIADLFIDTLPCPDAPDVPHSRFHCYSPPVGQSQSHTSCILLLYSYLRGSKMKVEFSLSRASTVK